MHELGITQEILKTTLEVAAREGAGRVNEVTISVGEMTEVVEFALQFNWDVVTKDTIAEGATLTVNMIPPTSRCGQCGTEFTHDKFDFTCPDCGNMLCEMIAGRELQIDSVDIDTDADGDGETDTDAADPAVADTARESGE